jgi:hypothetical protein
MVGRIELKKHDVIGLVAAAIVGASLFAGIGSGLLARAGVDPRLAYMIGFLGAALLLYPVIRVLADLKSTGVPGLVKWASVWTIALVLGFVFIYPMITNVLNRLFD